MLKKLSICMLSVCLPLFTQMATAQKPIHITGPAPRIDVTERFDPNKPQEFENPLYWDVKVTCTLLTEEADTPFEVDVLKGGGSVNGKHLSKGQSEIIDGVNGQEFKIVAQGQAKVRLINKGHLAVSARCHI